MPRIESTLLTFMRVGLITLVLLLVQVAHARADDELPHRAPLAMTVSGGVSLGAYEAGFQFYALEMARLNPSLFDLKLVAGASAGSLNSFLTILSYCGRAVSAPRHSLFWQSWIPLGYDQMFVPKDTTAVGMFSRRFGDHLSKQYLEEWQRGSSQACDVVFGVTTTRVVPKLMITAGGRLPLPRTEEKFVLRIQSSAKGAPLVATNYVDPEYRVPQSMLPTDANGKIQFDSLRDLIYASMSFPVAFAPQPVAHCDSEFGKPPHCLAHEARREPFIDGGVFDNVPLRLAARLVGAGLRAFPDGAIGWLPAPKLASFIIPERVRFLFLSPDAADYPMYEDTPAEIPQTLLSFLYQFASVFISTARSKNLYSLIEERPEMAKQILVPQRHYPAASGLLAAFLGFFETDFRIFDFYLGMYDARRNFDENHDRHTGTLVYPEHVYMPGDDPANPVGGWAAFLCMRSTYDHQPELARYCHGERLRQFRILMQVSIERLYENCARLGKAAGETTDNELCKKASAGAPPPTVDGIEMPQHHETLWRRGDDETEVAHALRLLAHHGFTFTDLGVGHDGRQALTEVRRRLGAALIALVKAQPSRGRALIALVAQVAADYLAYSPPQHILYFVLGRQIELGWSVGDPRGNAARSSFRFNLALLLDGLDKVLSSDRSLFGLGVAAGIEVQPTRLSNGFVQPRLVLRAGYLFAVNDKFGAQRSQCSPSTTEVLGQCSRFVTQVQLGVTLLERVRLQVLAEWYPSFRHGEKQLWSITPEIGVQFPF